MTPTTIIMMIIIEWQLLVGSAISCRLRLFGQVGDADDHDDEQEEDEDEDEAKTKR